MIDREYLDHDPLLAEIVRRVTNDLHPDQVYLFGSRARGDENADSDYDLLLVLPRVATPPYRLAQRAHSLLWGLRTAADVFVCFSDDFQARLVVAASLPATVVREGRLLYAA